MRCPLSRLNGLMLRRLSGFRCYHDCGAGGCLEEPADVEAVGLIQDEERVTRPRERCPYCSFGVGCVPTHVFDSAGKGVDDLRCRPKRKRGLADPMRTGDEHDQAPHRAAAVVVVLLNVDTVQIASTLWTDDATRAAVVARAEKVAQEDDRWRLFWRSRSS